MKTYSKKLQAQTAFVTRPIVKIAFAMARNRFGRALVKFMVASVGRNNKPTNVIRQLDLEVCVIPTTAEEKA